MIIKVCGITNTAQYCWLEEHGVDMIGINFYPQSKRYVSQLIERTNTDSTTDKIGVFVNPELNYLLEKVAANKLTMVQLHGNEPVKFCEEVAGHIAVIKAFGVDVNFNFADTEPYLESTRYFLFDTKSSDYGGSGKKFEWQKLTEYEFAKQFLLSGGIKLEDIKEIIALNYPALAGIDVNSGFEISPGNKDLSKINTMLELIQCNES